MNGNSNTSPEEESATARPDRDPLATQDDPAKFLTQDKWITAGVFERLEQICLDAYDRIVGLELGDLTVDGCLVKAPCGGEAAGKSPVDRGKQGTKRSVLTDGHGIPLGCVVAPANRHDSPLLRPTLEKLGRFGFDLPPTITVHLDAGYDSTHTRDLLAKLGCQGVISKKGFPLQAGARWVVERANSWHNRGFKKLQVCTERRTRVIDALIALANAIIIVRRLIRRAWTTHRWHNRPDRRSNDQNLWSSAGEREGAHLPEEDLVATGI